MINHIGVALDLKVILHTMLRMLHSSKVTNSVIRLAS